MKTLDEKELATIIAFITKSENKDDVFEITTNKVYGDLAQKYLALATFRRKNLQSLININIDERDLYLNEYLWFLKLVKNYWHEEGNLGGFDEIFLRLIEEKPDSVDYEELIQLEKEIDEQLIHWNTTIPKVLF